MIKRDIPMADETSNHEETKTIGQILKESRTKQEHTLEFIAKELCISKRHLKNLEEDDENIVADIYTIGFLKAYAQFLGLDALKLISQLKSKAEKPIYEYDKITLTIPSPKKGLPALPILGLSVCALVGIFVGLKWYNKIHSAEPEAQVTALANHNETAPTVLSVDSVVEKTEENFTESLAHYNEDPLPDTQNPTTIPINDSQDYKADSEETQNIVQASLDHSPTEVILEVTEEAWIQVSDQNGHIIVSRTFKPGEEHRFDNWGELFLKTGNARGTHLKYGEQKFDFPEGSISVQSNVPLDPTKWVDLNLNTQD